MGIQRMVQAARFALQGFAPPVPAFNRALICALFICTPFICAPFICAPLARQAVAQLVPGEFSNIQLDRELAGFDHFPTIAELRAKAAMPAHTPVLMLRLNHSENNQHHMPVWSPDGKRLAFQQSAGVSATASDSKVFVFPSLAYKAPILLTSEPKAYDYMFRWGLGKPGIFVFSRLSPGGNGARVMYSAGYDTAGQGKVESKTGSDAMHEYPSVYAQTDGVMRLAYEVKGAVMQSAWNADRSGAAAQVSPGGSPRWSRDGVRLLMLRGRTRSDRVTAYDVVIRNLKTGQEHVAAHPETGTLRSPVWSPAENRIAYFARDPGSNQPWRIEYCNSAGGGVRKAAADVVVNNSFKSEGPAWSPDGGQLWFFSHAFKTQAYFPLRMFDCNSSAAISIRYPDVCSAPSDVALNPSSKIPEIAFTGKDGQSRDLFVLLLNHF